MIETYDLTKHFDGTTAVEQLSLSVARGEVVALLGPNGAGKTTTVRMLACLIAPSGGTARVLDRDITSPESHEAIRAGIGLLTEAPGLYEQLSIEYNLRYYARLHQLTDADAAIERLLRFFDLWERRDEPAGTLSKGLKQRVAIARTLLHEPELLFLDEPTSGLDPAAARQVRDFLLELKREGRTILLTTHNLDEAERLADRIAVMSTRLIAVDTPAALRTRLFGRHTRVMLTDIPGNLLDIVRELSFVKNAAMSDSTLTVQIDDPDHDNPRLIATLVNAGAGIRWVTEDHASLEEIYLKLVQESE